MTDDIYHYVSTMVENPTLHQASTHAGQILQLTRETEDEDSPLGCPNHPFSDTHLLYPTPIPPSRWLTLQPAWVSCAEGAPCTPAMSLEPQRKSAAVHRGNPALPGVPAQPGTICPRPLTQEQHCQGGIPLTCCTLQAMWARPGTDDRSITTGVWT
ncbi:hypothetical protein Q8A73_007566 [Channa argus]|nr:hypothetical protein Q8A73_007566 [Channa argus]